MALLKPTTLRPSRRTGPVEGKNLLLAGHKKSLLDRGLLKRGLDTPDNCVLCDQEPEDINHLLPRCVFPREFWHRFSSARGTADVTPMRFGSVRQWWCLITSSMPMNKRKEKTVMAIAGMRRLVRKKLSLS
jgi:hypothetical protein